MSEDKCVNDCNTPIPDGGTWGYCDNCWNYVCVSSTLEKKDVMKVTKEMQMSEASCLAFGATTDALEKHFDDKVWNVEVRSTLGEDHWGNPIWSLTVFVESRETEQGRHELVTGEYNDE